LYQESRSMSDKKNCDNHVLHKSRRKVLKGLAAGIGLIAMPGRDASASIWEEFFQKHFRELSKDDLKNVLARLEKKYSKQFGKQINVKATPPIEGVLFGYGLDLSRCIGCRRCVYGCVDENNQSIDPQIHWITVLRFRKGEKWVDLENSEKYYNPDKVPQEDYFYMPVQCQQCENPPCVKVCPTQATWKDP